MRRQHDLAAEAARRGAMPGRGYAVARIISQVLHPVILSILSILIVALFGVGAEGNGGLWALLCTFLQIVPGMVFFTIRLRQGAYTDDDVSVRSQRNELYLFASVNLGVGLALLSLLGAPAPILAMITSATVVSLAAWVINIYWKISVHASSMGTTATIASLYSEPLGLALWLCALTLGWARLRTRNHTLMQVVAGTALAAAAVVSVFWAFGLL